MVKHETPPNFDEFLKRQEVTAVDYYANFGLTPEVFWMLYFAIEDAGENPLEVFQSFLMEIEGGE